MSNEGVELDRSGRKGYIIEAMSKEVRTSQRQKGSPSISVPIQLPLPFRGKGNEEHDIRQVAIDEGFPEEAANKLAAIESFNKHLYRPNTYLHKWWARRSGTTFRHILKQLSSNVEKRDFYEPGGLEGKVVFDPMMGGGTILHEAIRMGANVIGIDIDPIPVLQAKASLTVSSVAHKQRVFAEFLRNLKKELDPLFRTTCPYCDEEVEVQFLLYGLRRKCSCREVVFVEDLILREDNQQHTQICPKCRFVYKDRHHNCDNVNGIPLVAKGTTNCQACGARFGDIIEEPFVKRYVPLVVVAMCGTHGQFFKAVDQYDMRMLSKASRIAEGLSLGKPENFRVPKGPKSNDLLKRGITSFQELFTPRQLIYLNVCLELISGLAREDRLWLALLVSTSLEFNSLLCGYKGRDIRRPGAIRHVFSHHAYSFPYTALEGNPGFSGRTSGTLNRLFDDRIVRAGRWAKSPVETRISRHKRSKVSIKGEVDGGKCVCRWTSLKRGTRKFLVRQSDSRSLSIPEGIVDYVVTDPPYYDNVQYSDLSNFFRVWLRLFLPREADWHYDPLASAVSEGDAVGGRKYGDVIEGIWRTCRRALRKDRGRLIFTFHHWRHDAWAELTISLKKAGFLLVNRYVVYSENPISVHIRALDALKHDTILVLKPEDQDTRTSKWKKPVRIDTTDSYAFCRDCGTALGWLLASCLTEAEIRREWEVLLGGIPNGKTPK